MQKSKTKRDIFVSFIEPGGSGAWHAASTNGGGSRRFIDSMSIRYFQQGESLPRACDRIGLEFAEYGRAAMGLSNTEAAQFAATIQGLIASRFSGSIARVFLRGRPILLDVRVAAEGESDCKVGYLSDGPWLKNSDSVSVDIPLAPAPDVDAGAARDHE